MLKKFSFLFFAIWLVGCTHSKDNPIDCSTVLCMAASDTLVLYFFDATESSNRLDDDSIMTSSIEIRDGNNSVIEYSVGGPSNLGTYLMVPISARPYGPKSLNITFEGGEPFTISFTTSLFDDFECCGPYTAIDNIEATVYTVKPTVANLLPMNLTLLID